MTKRRKTHDGDVANQNQRYSNQDDDYIPLPIQTFLWRQTSPFVRPYLTKKAREMAQLEQRDACKLFERIIITNNIWGQSPSLTDAIASIDRWRLIKVSFPFVLQCTAALLNNKLIKDHNFNRLGGNEAKMMYTLQWILMNASEECADSENEAKANATNVVIAAATAASLLKPSNVSANVTSGSAQQNLASQGSTSSTASMTVDNHHQQHQQSSPSTIAAARAAATTVAAAVAGQPLPSTSSSSIMMSQSQYMVNSNNNITSLPIRVGSISSHCYNITSAQPIANQSILIPAASTAAKSALAIGAGASTSSALDGGSTTGTALQMQTTLPSSSSSVSPIGSSTPTKPLTPTIIQQSCPSNYLLPISSIQMFVYYFAPIMDGLKHSDFLTSNQRLEIGAALWEPLFNHQLPGSQCLAAQVKPTATKSQTSTFFASNTNKQQQQHYSPVTMRQQQQDSSTNMGDNRRRSSALDQAQFGDVFLGGQTISSSVTPINKQQHHDQTKLVKRTDIIETHHSSGGGGGGKMKHSNNNYSPIQDSEQVEQYNIVDTSYATYLDVAVLRCLFITDWQESGVYWALTYLANRLEEIRYHKDDSEMKTTKEELYKLIRPKSKSLSCIIDYYNINNIQNLSLKFKKYLSNNNNKNETKGKLKQKKNELNKKKQQSNETRQALVEKSASKLNEQQQQHKSYLKVEDAEASDSGGDGSGGPSSHLRSPIRRLSFSSSMQTLANQIRKTSKRVKKTSDNQHMGDSVTSESQSSIHQYYINNENKITSSSSPSAISSKVRRSSSADDLNSTQLTLLQQQTTKTYSKENIIISTIDLKKSNLDNDNNNNIELNPVITVSTSLINNNNKRHQQKETTISKKNILDENDNKQSSAKNEHKLLMQTIYSKSLKRLDRLTRSQTVPENLHISPFETRKTQADQSDSIGATHYIDDDGKIDPIVVLKVLHSISQRENACSQRVCDKLLSLVSKLINTGILKENFNFIRKNRNKKDLTNLLPTRQQHEFKLLHEIKPQILRMDSEQFLNRKQQLQEANSRILLIHKILIDIIFRLYHHLGCPNHCGMESTVDNHHQNMHSKLISNVGGPKSTTFAAGDLSGKQLRSKLRTTMESLCNFNKENFVNYVQAVVNDRSVQQIIDMFHSLLGFCRSDYLINLNNSFSQNLTGGGTNTLQHNQSIQFMPTQNTSGSNINETTTSNKLPLGSSSSPHSEISNPEILNLQQQQAPSVTTNKFCGPNNISSNNIPKYNTIAMPETVENIIITNSFKQLITRLAIVNKELKLQENTSLYCDIRRLISLIRDNYNSVFRSIVLSALIDCAKILNQQLKLLATTESLSIDKKRTGDFTRPPSDDESTDQQNGIVVPFLAKGNLGKVIPQQGLAQGVIVGDNRIVSDVIDNDSNTKISETAALSCSSSAIQQSPIAQHNNQTDGSPLMQHRTSFGSCRYYPRNQKQNIPGTFNQQDQQHSQSTGILSLSKAKKKLEQVFGGSKPGVIGGGGKSKLTTNSHLGEDLAQSGSIGGGPTTTTTTSGDGYNSTGGFPVGAIGTDETSRRASIIGHQSMSSFQENTLIRGGTNINNNNNNIIQSPLIHLTNMQLIRQNQQIYSVVQTGMTNFSFLMESCAPGDFLDPALLAALLDLKSPIAIRAAIYLECANFVHRCNRGQWPSWMKMNVSMHHRSSNAGIMQSSGGGTNSKFRKSSSIQRTVRSNTLMYRAAGRAFYSWAEAIGARLEELLQIEKESNKTEQTITEDSLENDDNQLTSEHNNTSTSQAADNQFNCSEIDFFQPTLGNTSSPFALKMAACQLLFEVTTFLRETYRYLPPTIIHHQTVGSKLGEKMTSIYDVSRAVTANRRWSMALSSIGFGQLQATLSAISAGAASSQQAASSGGGNHLRNPTTNSISEHPERRISFILHETNDENEQQDQQYKDGDGNSSSSQAITSPIAQSVNTNEQQQDAMRKMTAGRHLSQSSASSAVVVAAATCLLRSSGVIDSQTHRRKSIKLRKSTQEKESKDKRAKFAQDLDEENENSSISDAGVRRTDSLRSRRRVSGISEKSDTSDRATNNNNNNQDNQQIGASGGAELSGDESAGNGSCEDGLTNEAAEKMEADDSRIMSNMPWFKAVALINSSIDCNCTHYPNCRPYCYKLHQNMCKKLITCVQSIYEDSDNEQNYAASLFESRLANLMNLGNQQKNQDSKNNTNNNQATPSSGLVRAGSDCSATILNQSLASEGADSKPRKDKKSKKLLQQQLDSPDNEYSSPKIRKHDKSSGVSGKMHSMMNFQLDSMSGCNGISTMLTDAVKALTAVKAKKRDREQKNQEEPQIVKYMRGSVKSLLHCPMSSFLKGAVILPRDNFIEMIRFSWNLLLEDDQQLSRTAAVGFIISSIKCPTEASKLLLEELESPDASRKVAAINKFYVIWDARYQCWPRLEDGAFVHFKMAPPSIEFTLPSPKIAQESKPVVDPPWMPRKTSNVEEVTIGQDQTVQKSFVTATKTRRKQQIEIVTRALREKHDKLREDRENYHITSVPITLYAAYEPTLSIQSGGDEMDGGAGGDEDTQQESRALLQMKTAQALFPTCLCQAAIVMINLLDDSRVTYEGSAVYEIASKVIWSCLVDDPALFLRHFFERLTRQNQSTIFQVLRRLIRFMPRLPPQAAYTLYNYLIGFIIYYIRCPIESSQKLIADTLSVLCLVVPSVYGLFLKDLKQILRKEQCDHNLLITANVPSAKKIIVHGSDSSGIPSQFPIDESTQFYHILVDSLEFFGIDKPKQNEYFLIDVRTNHMHNVHSYVRDYYSFKRSQHPQLQLINMDPNKAFEILQKQELINQFLEFGKVSMSLSIVKSTHMAVQRVLFLHEELMKLPTFPRKALETNFCLFKGPLGHQVFSMDRIHKICWVRVIARMFELTSGFFLQLGDIHLFLNAISGIFVLHCEEASVLRLCLATFINATYQFKSIFATDGFMPIMATIVQVYSNHQNNQLLCRSIEFVCKQFYIMHRKPFLLQLFGSVASRLNTAELMQQNQSSHPLSSNQSENNNFSINDPSRISPTAFFRLLQSLEKAFKDPLDILELVEAEKPLRAVDFCYQQDKEAIEILDIISLCVTVTAYASESPRSTQMLIILETVVPLYMKHLQASTSKKAGQSMGKQAHKDELQKIQSISICIRTLIVNCEGLTRNFNGPLPSIDFRSSSIRRTGPTGTKSSSSQQRAQNNSAGSPIDMNNEEISFSGVERSNKRQQITHHHSKGKQTTIVGGGISGGGSSSGVGGYRNTRNYNSDESEITRGEFIVPRDTLLNLVAEFLALSTGRLMESAKKYVDLHQKHSSYELLDVKSHLRLAEVANSLLKFASTDPTVMACRGLTRYMNEILPNTEWRQEAIRPALIMILKRLDKTFNRIAKKTWVKRSTDWEGAKQLLKGAYLTFVKHPYIVHLPHLKSLISCCQNIILGDGLQSSMPSLTPNLFHGFATNQQQQQPSSSLAVSQSASAVVGSTSQQQQSTERQTSNLLNVVGSSNQYGSTLNSSGHATSAPITTYNNQQQQAPSFAAVTSAATIAATMAANAASSTSITSQGFNSVTIRLIAMQLLQTGDSQTLESFIGNSMNTPEKLESLMLNFLYPMCIRVCSGAREAPKLRVCDIMYILNIVLNMLAPQSASSKSCSSTVNSPKATTDTSQFILSKITTTIGSTQTGATALNIVGSGTHSTANAHQLAQHQENLKIGFLGLKILCVCFESQLASEWIRISRVIRDLALQNGQPSGPLWDFLDFVATYRFPMFILLLPTIKCHLSKKVKNENFGDNTATHNIQCQRLIDAKIQGLAPTICRSKSFLFVSLTAELRMLKEQLIAKRRLLLEGERQAASSHAGQQSQSGIGGGGSGQGGLSPNQANQGGDGSQQGDHSFTAYHRLSAALASFANQSTQAKIAAGTSGQLGTSAALKGTCFAAQLATSTPIGPQISDGSSNTAVSGLIKQPSISGASRYEPLQSSIRLSGAKSREEARKVMNTILRRTSYPHNQALTPSDQLASGSNERKNSQPPSPTNRPTATDIESANSNQIIMDPAMLMAAFPAPRKSNVEGSGILKQLIQTIDRNQKQKQQQQQPQQITSFGISTTSPNVNQKSQIQSSQNTVGQKVDNSKNENGDKQMETSKSELFTPNSGHKHS